MGPRVCMAEALCCLPETITALLIGYTPIQNKKLIFKKELPSTQSSTKKICFGRFAWKANSNLMGRNSVKLLDK